MSIFWMNKVGKHLYCKNYMFEIMILIFGRGWKLVWTQCIAASVAFTVICKHAAEWFKHRQGSCILKIKASWGHTPLHNPDTMGQVALDQTPKLRTCWGHTPLHQPRLLWGKLLFSRLNFGLASLFHGGASVAPQKAGLPQGDHALLPKTMSKGSWREITNSYIHLLYTWPEPVTFQSF